MGDESRGRDLAAEARACEAMFRRGDWIELPRESMAAVADCLQDLAAEVERLRGDPRVVGPVGNGEGDRP